MLKINQLHIIPPDKIIINPVKVFGEAIASNRLSIENYATNATLPASIRLRAKNCAANVTLLVA